MGKVKLMEPYKAISGKICSHSEVINVVRNGKQFTSRICNPRTTPPTEDEVAVRTKFAAAIAARKALTTQEKLAYRNAWLANKEGYATLQGYMFAKEYAKLA